MIARLLLPDDDLEQVAATVQGMVPRNLLQLARAARAGRPLPSLYSAGVVWRQQEKSTDYWQSIEDVLRDGAGDCKAFAAWRLAELTAAGVVAWPYIIRTGPHTLHALIQHASGNFEDPSRRLAM